MVILPLATGALVDLTFGVPLRAFYTHSANLSPAHLWALGMLSLKLTMRVVLAVTWIAPPARRALLLAQRPHEHVYFIEMLQIFAYTMLPPIACALALPYAVCFVIMPAIGVSEVAGNIVWRGFFPAVALLGVAFGAVASLLTSMMTLHDKIRDSLYLVGRKLHNIEQ